jgi:hypothetical protein
MMKSNITFDGNLAFFNNWELFWSSGKPVSRATCNTLHFSTC